MAKNQRFEIRLPETLHKKLRHEKFKNNVSINKIIVKRLTESYQSYQEKK